MNGVNINETLPCHLIIFDGVCNLCNGAVLFVIARDPGAQITFTPLQSETGQRILRQYNLPVEDFKTFVYIRDGKAHLRSTAALYVVKDIGGLWGLLYGFIIIPRFIRDFFYDLVARSRYSIWGKKDSCMVPTAELNARFL